jgi:hypothetical protein
MTGRFEGVSSVYECIKALWQSALPQERSCWPAGTADGLLFIGGEPGCPQAGGRSEHRWAVQHAAV